MVTWTLPGKNAMMALGHAANLSRLQRKHADSSGRGAVDARRTGRRLRQPLESALGRRSGERAPGGEPPTDRGFPRLCAPRRGVEERRGRRRRQIADLLGCASPEVVLTSGGSEANNLAIKGSFFAQQNRAAHIVTTQIEHPSVLSPLSFLEREGARITCLPVDSAGLVDPDDLRRALSRDTVLVSMMHANNETGTIQPIEACARIAREHGILFHTDAAQSVGKVATDVDDLGIDLLSVAGHKLYAPKGVGALYVRSGTRLESLIHGAAHEGGRRAGTESAILAAALGTACSLARGAVPLEK